MANFIPDANASYGNFARCYDFLMKDVDYGATADYIEEIIKKHASCENRRLLDLGCGTGKICLEFFQRGYDVTGIDISPEMLDVAAENARKNGADILFLQQDMTSFQLHAGSLLGVILCLMDGINHVTSRPRLQKMFRQVKKYLDQGGLFIFDINSPYKLKHILGNNFFYYISDDVSYLWQNRLNKKKNIVTFDLTFFIKEKAAAGGGEDFYRRRDVIIREKIYELQELTTLLEEAGLSVAAVYGEKSFRKPGKFEKRIFIVAIN